MVRVKEDESQSCSTAVRHTETHSGSSFWLRHTGSIRMWQHWVPSPEEEEKISPRSSQVLTSTRVSKHFNECMRITTAVNNRSAEERGQISMKYQHHYSSTTTQKHLNQHVPVEGTHFPCVLCHFLAIFTFDNQPCFHCRVPETTGKARRWMFSGDSRYAILDFRAKLL